MTKGNWRNDDRVQLQKYKIKQKYAFWLVILMLNLFSIIYTQISSISDQAITNLSAVNFLILVFSDVNIEFVLVVTLFTIHFEYLYNEPSNIGFCSIRDMSVIMALLLYAVYVIFILRPVLYEAIEYNVKVTYHLICLAGVIFIGHKQCQLNIKEEII